MKINLGDQISYSNKNEKLDIIGTVILIGLYHILVEIDHGTYDRGRSNIRRHTIYGHGYKFAQHRFELERSSVFRTISENCVWVPFRSKNLKSAYKEYTPSQEGDTEDDI